MINLLVISFHFPPQNSISARRPESFSRYFPAMGIKPTFVTLEYSQDYIDNRLTYYAPAGSKPSITKVHGNTVYNIPRQLAPFKKKESKFNKLGLGKMFTLWSMFHGHFEFEQESCYFNFKDFLFQHLKENPGKYQACLGIYSPYFDLRLCHDLKREFGLDYFLDFRDLHDNRRASVDYRFTAKEKLHLWLKERALKKWIGGANAITATSDIWAQILGQMTKTPYYRVRNGYEPKDFENIPLLAYDRFTIAHIGTFYEDQNIELFLKGLKLFLQNNDEAEVNVKFVGMKEGTPMRQRIESLKTSMQLPEVEVLGRIERNKALELTMSAHVLYYPAWTTTRGTYSGKIFEYIAANRQILVAPGDNDVIDELMADTQSGDVCNTEKEVSSLLQTKYDLWKSGTQALVTPVAQAVQQCTRESQAKVLAEVIKANL